ncbi:uncharacterized protein DSM5745_05130 [Aspergillus mulundensis]|uniref:C2H2-type domain-containing protein n=1 Tax=Aspergillus mulundensis TaxID=1810919 RepID=A0A3D8S5I7_9EURO|nr:hypothetical protein DSM5745_05130 [Aspergillus mulundensis]RDW81573.1 hypothetical protein DSM5745_05130 [Aspergillus mulundensis]
MASSESSAPTDLDALKSAIDILSEAKLRQVLKSLCEKVPQARDECSRDLLVDSSKKPIVQQEGEETTVLQPEPRGVKRSVARYAFCRNCKEEFDVTENGKDSCRYHPGKWLTPSDDDPQPTGEDLWVDNEFGVDDSMMEASPESWEFPCCEETLESNPVGCVVDWHVEGPFEQKQKRIRGRHWSCEP